MSKRKKANKAPQTHIWIIAAVIVLVVVICVVFSQCMGPQEALPTGTVPSYPLLVEDGEKVNINLGYGMYLVDVAKYTGIYMEDGSDEVVSGILMVVVTNKGTQDIQHAQIELPVGSKLACFTLTDLPIGESVVLLEQNRMAYEPNMTYTTAISKNVVAFPQPMDICADKVKIQSQDGVLNITNISGQDITGDVVIYYKNRSTDMFYGGITYRVVINGGIPAGQTKQIIAGHYTVSGSRIVHVTCG